MRVAPGAHSGRSCSIPAPAVARSTRAPSVATDASLAIIDRDQDDRADAVVLGALRGWSTLIEVRARVPEPIRWLVPAILLRLVKAGKAERRIRRWRCAEPSRARRVVHRPARGQR